MSSLNVNSDDSGREVYEQWLDDVAKHGLVDKDENEYVSVECSVGFHSNCTRPTCRCPHHSVHNV